MLALNLCAMGIPCVYYGTERGFDGAINNDAEHARTVWVTVDATLHAEGGFLTCLYPTESDQIGDTAVIESRNGRAARIGVPAGGFVAYA